MSKLLELFLNVDLRCAHDGLAMVAKKRGIDVKKLEPGQYVMFINCEKNRLKLFAANNIIAYLKLPHGKIDMRTLQLIPQAFHASGKIDYDSALKKILMKELGLREELKVA
jgi:hypothetical protein